MKSLAADNETLRQIRSITAPARLQQARRSSGRSIKDFIVPDGEEHADEEYQDEEGQLPCTSPSFASPGSSQIAEACDLK